MLNDRTIQYTVLVPMAKIMPPSPAQMTLTPQENIRYERQLRLDGFGLAGQMRLKQSRVLIVGAGGLGCPIALYLAGAGVGHLTVIDHDKIELSNIHRQVAYKSADVDQAKASRLIDTIAGINPEIICDYKCAFLSSDNAIELLSGYDLVIDGTDNFPTKFLIADTCYLLKTPFLHGSVHQYLGQVILFTLANGPCFRCIYNRPPTLSPLAACNEAGILGVVAGAVGMLMATEAVKHLAGLNSAQHNRMLKYDALSQSIQKIGLEKDPACPLCSEEPNVKILSEKGNNCMTNESNSAPECLSDSITISEAQKMLEEGAFLLDVREPIEYQQIHHPDAVLIPLARLREELPTKVPKDRPVVVYCQHGVRSLSAVHYMRAAGYAESYSITGGIAAWSAVES